MTRLSTEFERLYLPNTLQDDDERPPSASDLTDEHGAVRALVVECAGELAWDPLAALWRGVQAELEWPAPAIAVSGTDALQLWFSLQAPVDAGQAQAALQMLRQRFLPDLPSARLRLWPQVDPAAPTGLRHVNHLPGESVQPDQWSAFIAADLAPVFSETPWLDLPPGEDAQAGLLGTLRSVPSKAFEAAMVNGFFDPRPPLETPASLPHSEPAATAVSASHVQARQFLVRVMNDEQVPMALRVEAAKALLENGT